MSASEPERLHTSVLVAPAAERPRLRKHPRQAAARLQAEQRRAEKQAARPKAEAAKAGRRATTYLPAGGRPRGRSTPSPGPRGPPRPRGWRASAASCA